MLGSGLPEQVGDEEDLARFLYSSSHFNGLGPKPAAFLPSPRNVETSVFRHGAEPRAALWSFAATHGQHQRTLHGAAILKAREVRAQRLRVVADEPPPRHAAIRGWPVDAADPELQKARHKELALVLASHALLYRP